jgi:hypothetical protein
VTGELAVEVRHLVKRFGAGVTALDRRDLRIAEGETYGLLGPNGAGKPNPGIRGTGSSSSTGPSPSHSAPASRYLLSHWSPARTELPRHRTPGPVIGKPGGRLGYVTPCPPWPPPGPADLSERTQPLNGTKEGHGVGRRRRTCLMRGGSG